MTMSSMTDSLIASDPSKSAFLEFGHGLSSHQQHSPTLSHNHYPVHGLHSGGHPQHEGPFSPSASSYSRSLAYPYPGSVSSHHPSAYLSYQHNSHSSTLGHTRIDDPGRCLKKYLVLWFYTLHIFVKPLSFSHICSLKRDIHFQVIRVCCSIVLVLIKCTLRYRH